jgi:hypothetical protein
MMSKRKALTIASALLICATTWLVIPASAKEATLRIDCSYGANPTTPLGKSAGGGGSFIQGTPTVQNGDPDELTGGNLAVWTPTSPSSEDSPLLKSLWRGLVSWIRESAHRFVEAR